MSSYKNTKPEEYARRRRRDHANIEAMQNLVIARVACESGVEMPPNVRHLISALQARTAAARSPSRSSRATPRHRRAAPIHRLGGGY